MLHNRPTRTLGALLAGLLVLSNCGANDSSREPEQQESPTTVESVDPPPTSPATTLRRDDNGIDDDPDDSLDRGLQLPKLLDSILSGYSSDEQPIVSTGDMPPSILVSTEECGIAVVDTATRETTVLWEYSGADYVSYYCGPHKITDDLESKLPPDSESGISFVADVEWVDPGYVLISICCEPAAGRFELLAAPAISEFNEPFWLALDGGSPNVSDDGSFLFEMPTAPGPGFHTIGTVEFGGSSRLRVESAR